MPQTVGKLPIHIVDFDSAAGTDLTVFLAELKSSISDPQAQIRVMRQLPTQVRSKVLHDFLAASARLMIENNRSIQTERTGFLNWLRGELQTEPASLSGRQSIAEYEEMTPDDLIALLKRNQADFPEGVHSGSRIFQDRLRAEFTVSRAKVMSLKAENGHIDGAIDRAVFALYDISKGEIAAEAVIA